MDAKQEFLKALAECEQLSKAEEALLNLALEHTNGITAPQAAEALGYSHFVAANGLAGRLGRKIAEHLPYKKPDSNEWWTVIFTGKLDLERGFVWRLKPGLRSALTISPPL